jgi:hypothetical protein
MLLAMLLLIFKINSCINLYRNSCSNSYRNSIVLTNDVINQTGNFYFKKPFKFRWGNGDSWNSTKVNPFKVKEKVTVIKVFGSKGQVYSIDTEDKTCTCPGYTFRGACKHLTELVK